MRAFALAAIVGCGTTPSVSTTTVSRPHEVQLSADGDALVITTESGRLRVPLGPGLDLPNATADLIPLDVNGPLDGIFVQVGDRDRVLALVLAGRPSGPELLLTTASQASQPHIDSTTTRLHLLDLDGDGHYELVGWPMYGDDTGLRPKPALVWRRTGSALVPAPDLVARAPKTWMLRLFPDAPEARAVAAAVGAPEVTPLALRYLDLVPRSREIFERTLGIGDQFFYLMATATQVHLAVVRTLTAPATVLATHLLPCAVEEATRTAFDLVPWNLTTGERAVVIRCVRTPEEIVLHWDGHALTPAYEGKLIPGQQLVVEPHLAGPPTFHHVLLPAGARLPM